MALPSPPEIVEIDSVEDNFLDSQAITIVKAVWSKCKYERDQNQLLAPLTSYNERTAHYTAISLKHIKKICNEEDLESNAEPVNVLDYIGIIRFLKELYDKYTVTPNFDTLFTLAKKALMPDKTFDQFNQEMRSIGYGLVQTVDSRAIIMEDPKLTFERFNYLKRIKLARSRNKQIYYFDERIIDESLEFQKPWNKNDKIKPLDALVFLHVVSSKGYHSGLFCSPITSEDYTKWVIDIVLPILKSSSVVILDQNPLHSELVTSVVTRYHPKSEMLKWLKNNNIPHDSKMHKAELFELINKFPMRNNKQYRIDQALKANGHEVLRLPLYLHKLTASNEMWRYIKKNINPPPTFDLFALRNEIERTIMDVTDICLRSFDETVIKKENEIYLLDTEIQDALEKFEINTDDLYLDPHMGCS